MKTLAIRLEDDQHARLTILAKLSGISMTDAIRAAIEGHIDKLAADTDISAKAETVLADIEQWVPSRLASSQLVAFTQAEAMSFGQFASRITTMTLLDGLTTAVAWQRRETCLPHAHEVELANGRVNETCVSRRRRR